MSYRFIVNPKTNRNVSVDGRLGKQIINQYLNQNGGANAKNPLAFIRARQNKATRKSPARRAVHAPIPTPTRTHIPVPVLPTVETIGDPGAKFTEYPLTGSITGPFNIEYYDVEGRKILLMGETHNILKRVIEEGIAPSDPYYVHEYMLDIFGDAYRNGKCIDFYIEQDREFGKLHDDTAPASHTRKDESYNENCWVKRNTLIYITHIGYLNTLRGRVATACFKNKTHNRLHQFDIRGIQDKGRYITFTPMLLRYPIGSLSGDLPLRTPDLKKKLKRFMEKEVDRLFKEAGLDLVEGLTFVEVTREHWDEIKVLAPDKQTTFIKKKVRDSSIINTENIGGWYDYFTGSLSENESERYNSVYLQLLRLQKSKLLELEGQDFLTRVKEENNKTFENENLRHLKQQQYTLQKQLNKYPHSKSNLRSAFVNTMAAMADSGIGFNTNIGAFTTLWTHIMTDLYQFIRIFSDFPRAKMGRVPGCQDENYQHQNVVIYGGDAHIRIMSSLIKNVFGVEGKQWEETDEEKQYQVTIPEEDAFHPF